MYPLHSKINSILPKDEVSSDYRFIPGRGIKGLPPYVSFTSGPGKGSEILFRTYGQGAQVMAGVHPTLVVLDEPPPEAIFGEVQGRVGISRGEIRIGMTPTPDMPDVTYLRELVASGEVSEHNHGLTEDKCQPRGAPTPWIYQSEIDAYERRLLPVQREMRMRGAWDPAIDGLYVPDFDAHKHVACMSRKGPPPGATVFIGIDHGEAPGKQTMILGAGTNLHKRDPRVWAIDEVRRDGVRTTTEQDARDLYAMVLRNGLRLDNIDKIVGDRSTANGRRDALKSNRDLRHALAHVAGIPVEQVPRISTPRKGQGSVVYGCEIINVVALCDALVVDPRCVNLIASLLRFDGDPRSPYKDILDAFRYPVQALLGPRRLTALTARY